MTALKEFQRLEAAALWYAEPAAQRLDVIVTLGTATLTIVDHRDVAVAHWSLPAVERLNPGRRPAQFTANLESGERVEIEDDTMVRAIEKVRRAVVRTQPHPGRLRRRLTGAAAAVVVALAVFWLPEALIRYTAAIVPEPARATLGHNLMDQVTRVAGRPCAAPAGLAALSALTKALAPNALPEVHVVPGGVAGSTHLPGGVLLLGRAVVEDHESPQVVAGYILSESERAAQTDPLLDLLHHAGLRAALALFTTGALPEGALSAYAEHLLTTGSSAPETVPLLRRFLAAQVPSTPYAYAIDISGESTLALIEADPVSPSLAKPLLTDAEWVSLQGICGA